VLWRVHVHQLANGNPDHPEPDAPRPPEIRRIWHNAFSDLLKDNAGPVEEALAAMAPILSGATTEGLREVGREQGDLATSIGEAIRVSRRVGLNNFESRSTRFRAEMVQQS